MGNFNRNNRSGDRRNSGGRGSFAGRDFGGRQGGERELFDAVCNNCGTNCRVPFKPTGVRPVYCSDCFDNMDVRDAAPRSDRNFRDDRREYRPRAEHGNRPRFAAPQNDTQIHQLQQELAQVNAKLDRVLSLLAVKAES